jgi:hypothetical protein
LVEESLSGAEGNQVENENIIQLYGSGVWVLVIIHLGRVSPMQPNPPRALPTSVPAQVIETIQSYLLE